MRETRKKQFWGGVGRGVTILLKRPPGTIHSIWAMENPKIANAGTISQQSHVFQPSIFEPKNLPRPAQAQFGTPGSKLRPLGPWVQNLTLGGQTLKDADLRRGIKLEPTFIPKA